MIPFEDLPNYLPEGLFYSMELNETIEEKSGFMFRYLAEYNTEFRQPIPYILIEYNGTFFTTQRLSGSGESRLHGKISLGVGGHINPEDYRPNSDTIYNALVRELDEELCIHSDYGVEHLKSYINDNSNDVSRDHLAVVYKVKVVSPKVKVRETDKLEGRFYTVDELKANYDNLESWSQLVLENLILN